jgi:hypothetical protein
MQPGAGPDLFLACGTMMEAVYAFTVLADGSIVMTQWTGTSWTQPWVTVVGAPGKAEDGGTLPDAGAPSLRCFLSGFDRVAKLGASNQVGLLWGEVPESADAGCSTPEPTNLWTAFVSVPSP